MEREKKIGKRTNRVYSLKMIMEKNKLITLLYFESVICDTLSINPTSLVKLLPYTNQASHTVACS